MTDNKNNTTSKFFKASENTQNNYGNLPKKHNSIVTKHEKTYIVTRDESAIPQCNKFVYSVGTVALGVFWWALS